MECNFGFSTGICAAAASKASAIFLNSNGEKIPEIISVKNLDGDEFILNVFKENDFFGAIKNSGGDLTDITNGLKILAKVEYFHEKNFKENKIFFEAGEGVGIVTLPGLKIPPDEPAINPVPRKIIANAVREIIPEKTIKITISIPDGEKIAAKTFNPRLGIKGGLSILGTTGFVKPMNEKALLDSLSLELNMIKALGFQKIYITFGNTGEKFLRKIFDVSGRNVIQTGNYIGYVLDEISRLKFTHAIICAHAGKLLKVAAGSFNTNNKIADGRFEALCTHLALAGASRDFIEKIFFSNTIDEAAEIIKISDFKHIWDNIAKIISRKCKERIFAENLKVSAYFLDNNGEISGGFDDHE